MVVKIEPHTSFITSCDSIRPDDILDSNYLLQQTRWVRDVLDAQIAQEGPDALLADDILTLDELLRALLDSTISLELLRCSRIHFAILTIAGKATRWPRKLIDRCDLLISAWQASYGPLNKLKPPLYESGGRLHGICTSENLSQEQLLVRWLKSPDVKLSPAISRISGSLGFTPGDWWISPLFAHRAGIIDNADIDGGIVSDSNGAYAIVMTGDDEVISPDPEIVHYRTKSNDPGRYRLTSATAESRHPVRVLRSHTLHTFMRPRAGLRYDGLYNVISWTIKRNAKTRKVDYSVTLKRLASEVSLDTVLCRPWSDEVEDYMEYKRFHDRHQI